MKMAQIHSILNDVTKEITGKTAIVKEDLTNIIDIGDTIANTNATDQYVKSLTNHIGKVVFDNKTYASKMPNIFLDEWEYGSIMQKISTTLPDAQENKSYELVNGASYDVNVFHRPEVNTKFYNKYVTFEIPLSFTDRQVKGSFTSATQLNSFFSMISNSVENSLTVKLDALVQRTINNMIAKTVLSDYTIAKPDYTKSASKCINLLALYNKTVTTKLTVSNCLNNKDFILFCLYTIKVYKDRLNKISTMFNVSKQQQFTSENDINLLMLSDFASATDVFLRSNTYNNQFIQLNNLTTIPYWQGSGTDYDFSSTSSINVEYDSKVLQFDGVLACMFDKNSVGVCNSNKRVSTNFNAKGEFYNNYYKFDAQYFNDLNENFILFFIK